MTHKVNSWFADGKGINSVQGRHNLRFDPVREGKHPQTRFRELGKE